jgi:hypothetical protein
MKAWGKAFQELAQQFKGSRLRSPAIGPRPELDWESCLTSGQAGNEFRQNYLKAFRADNALKSNQAPN